MLCSIIYGINAPITTIIIINRKNNDVIEAKRLLNLSFDFRSDVNGLSINARTIDIAIYTITTLIFIKKNKNAPIPNKDRIDFKIDFVN